MQIRKIQIGSLTTENNVFLAPMAGYTDPAFRSVILPEGVGFSFTELVSAKGLNFGGEGSVALLKTDDYKKTGAQIFGSSAYDMRKAAESEALRDYSVIDINMGCPVPKVFKNGEGSALLTDIKKAEGIISECVKSGKNITVKIRTGQKVGDDVARDFAVMAESAGAKLVTVHGRVRESYYSGEPDYGAIFRAKSAVKIPVIANGGIFTEPDAEKMINETGADGIMIARGALSDPFLFCKLTGKTPTVTKKEFILRHIEKMGEEYVDHRAASEFKKFVPHYFKGFCGVKELKNAINLSNSLAEIKKIVENEYFE